MGWHHFSGSRLPASDFSAWLLKVQSPAPPLIALAGLLGMVLGEHAIPVVKGQFFTPSAAVERRHPRRHCRLPRRCLTVPRKSRAHRLCPRGHDGHGSPVHHADDEQNRGQAGAAVGAMESEADSLPPCRSDIPPSDGQ